jgi:hypothetical protein
VTSMAELGAQLDAALVHNLLRELPHGTRCLHELLFPIDVEPPLSLPHERRRHEAGQRELRRALEWHVWELVDNVAPRGSEDVVKCKAEQHSLQVYGLIRDPC